MMRQLNRVASNRLHRSTHGIHFQSARRESASEICRYASFTGFTEPIRRRLSEAQPKNRTDRSKNKVSIVRFSAMTGISDHYSLWASRVRSMKSTAMMPGAKESATKIEN